MPLARKYMKPELIILSYICWVHKYKCYIIFSPVEVRIITTTKVKNLERADSREGKIRKSRQDIICDQRCCIIFKFVFIRI